ncbi:hypothetical protein ACPW96_07945 [Micromonospora sp. DT81.3]|uniref:hypothetical protein n=1 Tax=Micromonospora sp. DT81.3 TaxID=3416523 RepID=UPI003CED6145
MTTPTVTKPAADDLAVRESLSSGATPVASARKPLPVDVPGFVVPPVPPLPTQPPVRFEDPAPIPPPRTTHTAGTPPVRPAHGERLTGPGRGRRRLGGTLLWLVPAVIAACVLGAVAYIVTTADRPALIESTGGSLTPPLHEAKGWLIENAERSDRLIVDDAMADDMVLAGWTVDDVIAYEELTTGSAAASEPLTAWTDARYIVTTEALRTPPDGSEVVSSAVENSVVVASFGTGAQAVEIRRIVPEGASAASEAEQRAASVRAAYGAELAQNRSVRMSDADRALLTEGRVDDRIAVVLAGLAAQGEVTVAGFPVIEGEQQESIREVALMDVAGTTLVRDNRPSPETGALLGGLQGRFAPDDVYVEGDRLILRYSVPIDALFD